MSKQSWVQCPETNKLVPRDEYHRPQGNKSAAIQSFEEFVSPVDGKVISCPSKLREHNKRNGVTNVQDYGQGYFDRRGREKYNDMIGNTRAAKQQRVNTIKSAMHKHGLR